MAAAVRNARLLKERVRLESAEAAARAVAAEREQAAQVLEAVGDGIFLVDGDGLVRLWNRSRGGGDGVSAGRRARAAAREARARLGRRSPARSRSPRAARGRAPSRCRSRSAAASLWLSFVAVRSAAGVVYAFRDLTGERRLEEEKTDLVTTISHELRTPMAAVYGAARDAAAPRRRADRRAAAAAPRDDRHAGDAPEPDHRGGAADEQPRPRRAAGRSAAPVDVGELVATTVEAMRARHRQPRRSRSRSRRGRRRPPATPTGSSRCSSTCSTTRVKYGGGGAVRRARRERERGGARVGRRLRPRDPARRPRAHLREVLPRRPAADARAERHRPRPLHLARARAPDGRPPRRHLPPGAGATFVLELPAAQRDSGDSERRSGGRLSIRVVILAACALAVSLPASADSAIFGDTTW